MLIISFLVVFLLSPFFIFFKPLPKIFTTHKSHEELAPKLYPFIGNFRSFYTNRHRFIQWTSDVIRYSITSTFILRQPFSHNTVITANPSVVKHILFTKFSTYEKGEIFRTTLHDLLGDGIFNIDGDAWKLQRKLFSHEFSTRSLRNFIENVVDCELNERLLPILANAAKNDSVVDLQDILQRFTFDNICIVAFGYDPAYLTPSLPKAKFAVAFEDAVRISTKRFNVMTPLLWKIKRFFNMGTEKRLKEAVLEIRQFAMQIINQKKQELSTKKSSILSFDLLSRLIISSSHSDDKLVMDIVISFILAGRDSTLAALTWFFWLIFKNPAKENEIVKEIKEKSCDEVKDMAYTHDSLCESMRFYPPVPIDSKIAGADDVLPDGTIVKKGMRVIYHPYGMGRLEKLWGNDWMEFQPNRWLEKDETTQEVRFIAKDPYMYPVFQAGPRTSLGKEMSFLQMKRVVSGILRRFKVVPSVDDTTRKMPFSDLISDEFEARDTISDIMSDVSIKKVANFCDFQMHDAKNCDSQRLCPTCRGYF